jgi:hypothetical protein
VKSSVQDRLLGESGQPEGHGASLAADAPALGPKAMSDVLSSEQLRLSQASFQVPPDIDSPVVDGWIEEHRRTHGPTKIDLDQLQRNMERLRQIVGPIIRGA